jgi:hypothetical protein
MGAGGGYSDPLFALGRRHRRFVRAKDMRDMQDFS